MHIAVWMLKQLLFGSIVNTTVSSPFRRKELPSTGFVVALNYRVLSLKCT